MTWRAISARPWWSGHQLSTDADLNNQLWGLVFVGVTTLYVVKAGGVLTKRKTRKSEETDRLA